MWTTKTDEEKKVLGWNDFPAATTLRDEIAAPQIAAYLRRILEKYEDCELIKYLVVPSPIALSGFFHCAESEIHHALHELQRQGYEFETAGSSGPITLWDPLIRRKALKRDEPTAWQVFCQSLFNPARRQIAS